MLRRWRKNKKRRKSQKCKFKITLTQLIFSKEKLQIHNIWVKWRKNKKWNKKNRNKNQQKINKRKIIIK
jgi:hypothetical protein